MSDPKERVVKPDGVIDRSFDAITEKERVRLEKAEKERLKVEAKLTSKLQKVLETDTQFGWELIPAHSRGGQTWSDFRSRAWGSNGRPIAVTYVEDVVVVAHFNENLFRQFSFGVTTEKPPYNFAEIGSTRQSPSQPTEYGFADNYYGAGFRSLLEFGEEVIKLRSAETE